MTPALDSSFKELAGRLVIDKKPQWVIDAVAALWRFCETGEIPRPKIEQPAMEIIEERKPQ